MDDSRNSHDPRYGAWKFIQEIELTDMLANPIWLWCLQLGLPDEDDGLFSGDETSMRPLLESDAVPLQNGGHKTGVRSCNNAFSLTNKVRLCKRSEPQSEPVVRQAR